MVLSLPADLEEFVKQAVSSGRFPSREALLVHAVRLLWYNCDEAQTMDAHAVHPGSDKAQPFVRRHDAFLNSYSPSDEGLYDDFAG